MTASPLLQAHQPLRPAAPTPQTRGGEGAHALAAAIKFRQLPAAPGDAEPMPGLAGVRPRHAEEVFQL
jgi:hypothetical protein